MVVANCTFQNDCVDMGLEQAVTRAYEVSGCQFLGMPNKSILVGNSTYDVTAIPTLRSPIQTLGTIEPPAKACISATGAAGGSLGFSCSDGPGKWVPTGAVVNFGLVNSNNLASELQIAETGEFRGGVTKHVAGTGSKQGAEESEHFSGESQVTVTTILGDGVTKPPTSAPVGLGLEKSDDFAGESRVAVTDLFGDGVTRPPTSAPVGLGLETSDGFAGESKVAVTGVFGDGITKQPTRTTEGLRLENSDDFVGASRVAATNDFGGGVTKPPSGTTTGPRLENSDDFAGGSGVAVANEFSEGDAKPLTGMIGDLAKGNSDQLGIQSPAAVIGGVSGGVLVLGATFAVWFLLLRRKQEYEFTNDSDAEVLNQDLWSLPPEVPFSQEAPLTLEDGFGTPSFPFEDDQVPD
jgi:hypothetical protein